MNVKTFKRPTNIDKDYVKTIATNIDPKDNFGESISIEVDVFANNGNIFTTTHISIKRDGVGTTKTSLSGIEKIVQTMTNLFPLINEKV